jgi:hypothetical protein
MNAKANTNINFIRRGSGNGINIADYYHYLARGGLPDLAS